MGAFADHYKLPPILRKRVLKYFRGLSAEKSAQNMTDLTAELSPDLLKELSTYLVSHAIMYNSLFQGVPFNALIRLQSITHRAQVEKGSNVVSVGDAGTAMFIVTSGALELRCPGKTAVEDVDSILRPGDSFGEEIIVGITESYLYDVPALMDTIGMMMDEQCFIEALEFLPDCVATIARNAANTSRFAQLFPQKCQEFLTKIDESEFNILKSST